MGGKQAPVSPRDRTRPDLLSIVCPAYNEEAGLADFHRAVRKAMIALDQPFEVVFVNDGSSDATLDMMRKLRARHPNTAIVDLSRNFGKEIALTAGLDAA
ncbi:MAG: glycosyltransferase, partial [Amphiplicatus sp.]